MGLRAMNLALAEGAGHCGTKWKSLHPLLVGGCERFQSVSFCPGQCGTKQRRNARTTSGMRLASADTILMYSSAVAGRLPSSRGSSVSIDGTGRARRGSISSSPSSPDLTKSFAIEL
jgi:hypothetical protein